MALDGRVTNDDGVTSPARFCDGHKAPVTERPVSRTGQFIMTEGKWFGKHLVHGALMAAKGGKRVLREHGTVEN